MGMLKGVQMSFESLISCSKLQEVMEVVVEQLSEHEQLVKPLQADLARLREDHDSSMQRNQAASGEELVSRLANQDRIIQQLSGPGGYIERQEIAFAGLQIRHEEMSKQVEKLTSKEEARQMAMPNAGEELPPEIRAGIDCALAPLRAAIAALDAKIESQLVVRLEAHESRLGEHEHVHKNVFEALHGELLERSRSPQRGWNGSEQEAARQNSIVAVKQEVSDLSRKLSEVATSVGSMETEMMSQSDLTSSGRSEIAEMLSEACTHLESRVSTLEGSPSKDISEMAESLKQLQSAARSLEGIVSKDVQPKLDTQGTEMHRLAGDLTSLCSRINSMITKTSMATTSTIPGHCLACKETRNLSMQKVLIGRDGKAYQQGNGLLDDDRGLLNTSCRPKSGDRMSMQGGAGAPLRKYRIPVGADGNPTWSLVRGQAGAASVPSLPTPVERGRGLPPPGPVPSRPQSATLLGRQTGSPGSRPLLGKLPLAGLGAECEPSGS